MNNHSLEKLEKLSPLLIETVLKKVTKETYPEIFPTFEKAAHAICHRALYKAELLNKFFDLPMELPAAVSIDIWKQAKAKNRLDQDGRVEYGKALEALGDIQDAREEINAALNLAFDIKESLDFSEVIKVLVRLERLGGANLNENSKQKLFELYVKKLGEKEESAFPNVIPVLKAIGNDNTKKNAIIMNFEKNMDRNRLPSLDHFAYYGLALEELGKTNDAIAVYRKIAVADGCLNKEWAEEQLIRLVDPVKK